MTLLDPFHPAFDAKPDFQRDRGALRHRYNCGCSVSITNLKWHLCQYHEGYDDGVEAARRSAA